MAFYTPRNIGPADQVLFDSDGNAVGIQPAASSSPPVLGFNPKKHAAIDSLVSEDGGIAQARVFNPAALAKAARRLAQAPTRNVNVGLFGDSLSTGTGATASATLATNTTAADQYGLVGVLRKIINNRFQTKGGGWISAASTAGQITQSGSTLITGYGPHWVLNGENSRHINTAASYVQWALPACTEISLMTWEDTTASYGVAAGPIDVSVDGGGATTYTGTGGASVQKLWQVANMTGLSDATHTVRATRNAGNNLLHGCLYSYGTGVTCLMMGIGSATSEHLRVAANTTWTPSAAQTDRIARATFQTVPLDVAIIIIGHNDASQQVARSLTPSITAANIQATIEYLRANSGAPVILLVTDPDPNLTGSPLAYSAWWPVICALADGTTDVAAITTADLIGTYAQGNAEGYYSDMIHQTSRGYAVWGAALADILLQPRSYA